MDGTGARAYGRRSRRDRAVDIAMFALALGLGITAAVYRRDDPTTPRWLLHLDEVVGALGCLALGLRRRWPVGLALVLVVLSTFSELVAESVRAGATVSLETDLAGTVPDHVVGRTVYRIVQEALTNARKHAPGAPVRVRISGTEADGLSIEVDTEPAAGPPAGSPVPGAGQGLAGLTERATLVGGRLSYGPTGSGGFRLSGWLPWHP